MNTTIDSQTQSAGANPFEEAIKRTASAAHSTVDRLADAAESAQHRVHAATANLGSDVNKFVTSHPLQSLAGAVALGFLLGRFFR